MTHQRGGGRYFREENLITGVAGFPESKLHCLGRGINLTKQEEKEEEEEEETVGNCDAAPQAKGGRK